MVRRIFFGLLLAAVATWALQWGLARDDAPGAAPPLFRPPDQQVSLPAALPRGRPRRILLLERARRALVQAEPDWAPVVRFRPGGNVQVRRGAPLPAGPDPDDAGRWATAVVELPGSGVAALGPGERARLLELLRAWGIGSAGGGELVPAQERLLRWLR